MRVASEDRSNAEWLRALRPPRRSGEAIEELRTFLRGALGRLVRTRGGVDESDLDDFTQDALIRVLQGLERFRGDSRFTTWASAIAVRVALSALRRRRHATRSLEALESGAAAPDGGVEPGTLDPGRAMDQQTLLSELHRAIREGLTERQRTVILGELDGVPSSVLVERLGTNPNALYKLHHDARKKLKRALNEAGYRDEDVRQQLASASEAP